LTFDTESGAVATLETEAGFAGLTWVDVGKDLSAGHFTPDVSGAHFAKVDFVLHLRLDVLHVAVDHWHRYHGEQGGHGGNGNTKESNTPHGGCLGFSSLYVIHG
jgi:hypothetical protein